MDRDWIEHRRGRDGVRLGWLRMSGDGFVAVDLLGRPRTDEVDWEQAEAALDDLGMAYLAEAYELHRHGERRRVRVVEVTTDQVRVRDDHGDAIEAPRVGHVLPWPVPADVLRDVAR